MFRSEELQNSASWATSGWQHENRWVPRLGVAQTGISECQDTWTDEGSTSLQLSVRNFFVIIKPYALSIGAHNRTIQLNTVYKRKENIFPMSEFNKINKKLIQSYCKKIQNRK